MLITAAQAGRHHIVGQVVQALILRDIRTGSRMVVGQEIDRPITSTTRRTGGRIGSVGPSALIGGRDMLARRGGIGAVSGRLGAMRSRGIVEAVFVTGIPLRSRLFSVVNSRRSGFTVGDRMGACGRRVAGAVRDSGVFSGRETGLVGNPAVRTCARRDLRRRRGFSRRLGRPRRGRSPGSGLLLRRRSLGRRGRFRTWPSRRGV
ncbi:hypothetical protein [Nocardia cyriacigeorgica]|uniref:hypothetical protein n=1 Tax=Nocardia cyriacigeorgica TaxID=135487 RepID=UPI002456760F|nr:hypothetical protein [Nocardia cyriacigeorgica]